MKRRISIICLTIFFASKLFISTSVSAQVISAGFGHSLAICNDKTVRAWGDNTFGGLGNGTSTNTNVPIQMNVLSGVVKIEAGIYSSIALRNDSTVWVCGDGSLGQMGNGTTNNSNIPIQVIGLTGIVDIKCGGNFFIALRKDGTVWAWGNNNLGQLGDGSIMSMRTTPVQVSNLTGVVSIACHLGDFSLALKSNGTVWAWGDNSKGQLGDGSTSSSNVPLQVVSLSGINSISGGSAFSFAMKNDGTIWAWGGNSGGELGDGTTTDKHTPVQITSITGVSTISCATSHTLFLKSDGTVYACGFNATGQLGDGTNTEKHTPVLIAGLASISAISAGAYHSLFLKNDGTLWSCGGNAFGCLGDGTYTDSNVPVQVISLCNVVNGIEEQANELTTTIFPNPANNKTNLLIHSSKQTNIKLAIFDLLGNIIQREIREISSGDNEIEMNLSKLSSGIYFLGIDNSIQKIQVIK